MSEHFPGVEMSSRMDLCAHLIQTGTPVAEAMREVGYREAFIAAEADAFVETYLSPKGIKVTGGRGRAPKATASDETAEVVPAAKPKSGRAPKADVGDPATTPETPDGPSAPTTAGE